MVEAALFLRGFEEHASIEQRVGFDRVIQNPGGLGTGCVAKVDLEFTGKLLPQPLECQNHRQELYLALD